MLLRRLSIAEGFQPTVRQRLGSRGLLPVSDTSSLANAVRTVKFKLLHINQLAPKPVV